MLKNEAEKNSKSTKLEDVEPKVFQELLRFLCTGRLSVTTMESIGAALLIAVDRYKMFGLETECEK